MNLGFVGPSQPGTLSESLDLFYGDWLTGEHYAMVLAPLIAVWCVFYGFKWGFSTETGPGGWLLGALGLAAWPALVIAVVKLVSAAQQILIGLGAAVVVCGLCWLGARLRRNKEPPKQKRTIAEEHRMRVAEPESASEFSDFDQRLAEAQRRAR